MVFRYKGRVWTGGERGIGKKSRPGIGASFPSRRSGAAAGPTAPAEPTAIRGTGVGYWIFNVRLSVAIMSSSSSICSF